MRVATGAWAAGASLAIALAVAPNSASSNAANSGAHYTMYGSADAQRHAPLRAQIGLYYAAVGNCPRGPVFGPVAQRFQQIKADAKGSAQEVDIAIVDADWRWDMRRVRIACPSKPEAERAVEENISAKLAGDALDRFEQLGREQVVSARPNAETPQALYGAKQAEAGSALREASWQAASHIFHPCGLGSVMAPAERRYQDIVKSETGTSAGVDIAIAEADYAYSMSLVDILCDPEQTEAEREMSQMRLTMAEDAMDQMEALVAERHMSGAKRKRVGHNARITKKHEGNTR